MKGETSLQRITFILKELGGYFTFFDDDGREFVVVRKEDAAKIANKVPETQLTLQPQLAPTPEPVTADDVLEKINRDIAYFNALQEDEGDFDDIGIDTEKTTPEDSQLPPPKRVRFEPLRGDLPPELQE